MTTSLLKEIGRADSDMADLPCWSDALTLAALPSAISCARLFTRCTLGRWGASFVLADALIVVGELVANAVADTGVADTRVRWSELTALNVVSVRLLGFAGRIVIEVWDTHPEPAVLPAQPPGTPPCGLRLVDVIARRWDSRRAPGGRLTWAELATYEHTRSGLPLRASNSNDPHRPATADLGALRRVMTGLMRM
jgi:hypothetical protein